MKESVKQTASNKKVKVSETELLNEIKALRNAINNYQSSYNIFQETGTGSDFKFMTEDRNKMFALVPPPFSS